MERDFVFSDEQVVDFCESTRDHNVIHNPQFMLGKGKHVVVPGMFLFSIVASMLYEEIGTTLNTYRIYLSSIVSTGESLRLGFEGGGSETEKVIYAFNGKDSFSLKDDRSRVYLRSFEKSFPDEGNYKSLPFEAEQLSRFGDLIHCNNPIVRDFLFGIAYASNALLQTIENPATEVEKEINLLLDKTKNPDQVSPFYQSLDIFLPTRPKPLIPRGKIDYRIHFEREKANRSYIAHVQCEQDGEALYKSEYKLIAIPDRLILRMAKDRL